MTSLNLPRLTLMMQPNAITYGAYQLTNGQRGVRRAPTIGAPEIMLTPQPAANLKRRAHIRRTSRSGSSPTLPEGHEALSYSSGAQPSNKPQLQPLTTAFTRSVATSTSSGSILARQPTLIDHSSIEWRNAPQYQPKMAPRADLSRSSTIASVYSLSSAAPHSSRRPTQENYVIDWSFVDNALQNRTESPSSASSHTPLIPPRDHSRKPSTSASQDRVHRADSRSRSTPVSLSRVNTSQVRSMIVDRRRRRDVRSDVLRE